MSITMTTATSRMVTTRVATIQTPITPAFESGHSDSDWKAMCVGPAADFGLLDEEDELEQIIAEEAAREAQAKTCDSFQECNDDQPTYDTNAIDTTSSAPQEKLYRDIPSEQVVAWANQFWGHWRLYHQQADCDGSARRWSILNRAFSHLPPSSPNAFPPEGTLGEMVAPEPWVLGVSGVGRVWQYPRQWRGAVAGGKRVYVASKLRVCMRMEELEAKYEELNNVQADKIILQASGEDEKPFEADEEEDTGVKVFGIEDIVFGYDSEEEGEGNDDNDNDADEEFEEDDSEDDSEDDREEENSSDEEDSSDEEGEDDDHWNSDSESNTSPDIGEEGSGEDEGSLSWNECFAEFEAAELSREEPAKPKKYRTINLGIASATPQMDQVADEPLAEDEVASGPSGGRVIPHLHALAHLLDDLASECAFAVAKATPLPTEEDDAGEAPEAEEAYFVRAMKSLWHALSKGPMRLE